MSVLTLLLAIAHATPASEAAHLAFDKRTEAMHKLKELLDQPELQHQRSELLLRLGELRVAHARQIEGWEREACLGDPDCHEVDDTAFRPWYVAAERAYAAAIRDPRFERADEAAYLHADVLRALGRHDEAHAELLRLVKSFPGSDLAPQAYALIGDRLFDDGVVHKALVAYRRAAADPASPIYGWALRRQGWCHYHLGEYDAAIALLLQVVALDGEVDDAIHDLVRFYADAGRLDEAERTFERLGRPDLVAPVLARIADLAEENGQIAEAIHARRSLILRDPNSEEAAEQQAEIVAAYRSLGLHDEALDEVQRLLADFEGTDDAALAQLRAIAADEHEQSRKLARGRHAEAEDHRATAARAYEAALGLTDDAALRFGLAELRYEQNRYADAYPHYLAVVRLDPDGTNAAFAASAAVHAAEALVDAKEGGPWTDADQRLLDACDLLVASFPDAAKARDAWYKAGHLLYRRGRIAEAADRFEQVIARDPRSKEAEYAAHLILDGLAVAEDWAELEARAAFFAGQEGLGTASFRAEVREIEQRAAYKRIDARLATDGDRGAAGEALLAWVDRYPDSAEVPRALNDAAAHLARAGRFDDAVAAREALLVRDPDGPYAQAQLAELGWAYESVVAFDRAAEAYERLRDAWVAAPSDRVDADAVADAAHTAAVLWNALGEGERAIAAYEAFATAFEGDARVPDARLSVGRVLGELGRHDEAASVFAAFVADPRGAASEYVFFARVHEGRALEAAGRQDEAVAAYERTAAAYRAHVQAGGSPGAWTAYAAEALYRLAEPRYAEFAAIELVGHEAEKVRSLEAVKRAYEEVASLGAAEWGLRALVKVGLAHEEMARALRAAPCDEALTEAQCAIARMGQEDLAYLADERSADAYEAVLARSAELGFYGEPARLAASRLGALPAERLPELRPTGAAARASGPETTL